MPLAESILIAMCASPSNKELQACQAVARAIYSQNSLIFKKLDDVEVDVVANTPTWFKHTIVVIDVVTKQQIYVPIIDRRF